MINKFFAPTILESSMLYVGNLITQYFAHVSTKVETDILDSVVRKIYKVNNKFTLVKDAFYSSIFGYGILSTNNKIS